LCAVNLDYVDVEQIFSGILARAFKIIFSRKHGFIEVFRQLHVLFPTIFFTVSGSWFFYLRPQGGIFNGGIAVFGEMFKSPPPPPPPPNRKKMIKNSVCTRAAFECFHLDRRLEHLPKYCNLSHLIFTVWEQSFIYKSK